MCASAIFQAKIPRVVIGAIREDLSWLMRPRKIHIGDLVADLNYSPQITTGVLKDGVLNLFKDLKR